MRVHACVCVSVCVVSVIVKCPVLPPCAVDGHSRNPLLLLFYYNDCLSFSWTSHDKFVYRFSFQSKLSKTDETGPHK